MGAEYSFYQVSPRYAQLVLVRRVMKGACSTAQHVPAEAGSLHPSGPREHPAAVAAAVDRGNQLACPLERRAAQRIQAQGCS